MANRTWIQVTLAAADHAKHADAIDDLGFEDSHCTAGSGVSFSRGDTVPDSILSDLDALEIPYIGQHGSHPGDYCAYLFASDGETLLDHSCDEDGNLSIAGLLESGTLPPAAFCFFVHYLTCRAKVFGTRPPSADEIDALYGLTSKAHDLAMDTIQTASSLPDPYTTIAEREREIVSLQERLGKLDEFVSRIARFKKEGEYYDDHGKLIEQDEAEALGIESWEPPGTDDEIDALYELISVARHLTSPQVV